MTETTDTQTLSGGPSPAPSSSGLVLRPYHEESAVTIYHGDCRHILPLLDRFDLLLTDPPYGIEGNKAYAARENKGDARWRGRTVKDYVNGDWDKEPVESWVIEASRTKCKWQIIFGGNYYNLPPSPCWLVWDKEVSGGFADCELAWTNLTQAARLKRYLWNGFRKEKPEERYHPTQKPLAVIQWALSLAGEVKTILDPWAGSGTTGEAAKLMGKKAVLIEREERYCEIAARRLAQDVLLLDGPNNKAE